MALGPLLATLRNNDPRAFLKISGDWRAMLRVHFLFAALDSGLLAALREPRSRPELERALRVERPEMLEALLELGTRLGELGRRGGRFRLAGRRSRALARPENDALAAMVQANATYYNAAYRHFAERLRGGPLGEEPRSFGPLVARLSTITEPYVAHYLKGVLKGRGPVRVLDVGCGGCAHLRGVLDASPGSTGVGLEMDAEVVREAEENLAAWGLRERVRVVRGDAGRLPADVGGDFDLVLALSMIYYVEVPEREALLATLRSRLAEGGALVLATSCRGEGVDLFSANLNMATSSMVGLTPLPTVEEMEAQLRGAGFTRLRRTRLVPGATYFGITAS